MNGEQRKSIARHIGAALRHARAAQELNLNGEPTGSIVRELRRAHHALDDAERLAECCKGAQ